MSEDRVSLKPAHLRALIKESIEEIISESYLSERDAYSKGVLDGSKGIDPDPSITQGRSGGVAIKSYEEGYAQGFKAWLAKQPKKPAAPRWEE